MIEMPALLDTSFLFALTDQQDRNHIQVTEIASALTGPLVLATVVLPEISYLINSRLGHSVMRRFLTQLVDSDIELEMLCTADLSRTAEILNVYSDSKLDFIDAAIIAIAERRNITQILTLDRRDFSIIRPKHCDYFEIKP